MPTREQIVRLDKAHVWHPYTAMDVYVRETDPFVVARASGARLYDLDGREYLDAGASWWVSILGHNHPRLVAALERQAKELCHCSLAGTTHREAALLAAELAAVAPPGLGRVFFSDDGSTAVEVAVKMALQYFAQKKGCSRKRKLVALEDAFHGETIGAASLGGVEAFRAPFGPALFACLRIPSPAGPLGSLEASAALRDRFADDGDEIAAIVLEPLVQGAAGMRVYDPGFLVEVRELCSRHDVLLIADEVFTGYGRTGRMWACDHAGVTPDILCVGKGFSGGMLPMAATLATEQVFEGFYGGRSRAFLYGHSYCGNPLGAAVAREVLAVLREDDVIAQTRGKAERIAAAFHAMQALPFVSAPRALGMIGALDLQLPHGTNLGPVRDGVEAEADLSGQGYLGEGGWLVYEAARRRGVFLRPLGETVYVCPPLVIGHADLERVLRVVRESIEEVVESAMMRSTSESWRPPPVG